MRGRSLIIFILSTVFQWVFSGQKSSFNVVNGVNIPSQIRDHYSASENDFKVLAKQNPDNSRENLYIVIFTNRPRLAVASYYHLPEKYEVRAGGTSKLLFNFNDLKKIDSNQTLRQKTIDFALQLVYEREALENINPDLLQDLLNQDEFVSKFNEYVTKRLDLDLLPIKRTRLAYNNLRIFANSSKINPGIKRVILQKLKNFSKPTEIASDEDSSEGIPINGAVKFLFESTLDFFSQTPPEIMNYLVTNDSFIAGFERGLKDLEVKEKFEMDIREAVQLINQVDQNAWILLNRSVVDPAIKENILAELLLEDASDFKEEDFQASQPQHNPLLLPQRPVIHLDPDSYQPTEGDFKAEEIPIYYSGHSEVEINRSRNSEHKADFDLTDIYDAECKSLSEIFWEVGYWWFCPIFWLGLILFGIIRIFCCLGIYSWEERPCVYSAWEED